MSLVICSNQIDKDNTGSSSFQSAYSFHNHLNDTMVLPPNSEVAVQSVKINKKGTLSLPANTKFGVYVGEKLTDVLNWEQTTSWTKECSPVNDTGRTDLFPEEYALAVQKGFNRSISSPEYSKLVSVKEKQNATTLAFEGFDFSFTQLTSARDDTKADNGSMVNLWANTLPSVGLTYDAALFKLSASSTTPANKAFDIAYSINEPVALNDGLLEVDLTDAGACAWAVGFSRADPLGLNAPVYFNPDLSDIATTAQLGIRETYFDYVVGSFQYHPGQGGAQRYLRAYHGVKVGDLEISTKECAYYDDPGNHFHDTAATKGYNWSTNTSSGSGIDRVKFEIQNEQVKVSLRYGGTYYTMVDPAADIKARRFKPVGDTTRFMYPRYSIQKPVGNTAKSLTIVEYRGRADYTAKDYADPFLDWWSDQVYDGSEMDKGALLDTRFMYDMTNATDYIPKGLDAGNQLDGYNYAMIMGQNDRYIPSFGMNVQQAFGFPANAYVDAPTPVGIIFTFSSVAVPKLESNTSIFVALKNINVKSFNAGAGVRSQILYSCPKFDNAGAAAGEGLYYEPHQRLYVKCNNPNNLVINDFDINLVNENETLANDLVGKSVVILHFRKSQE
tara:strand:+ start:1235 stop:3079 length:1845 start_codon:yes stop_codon:yes gene_type:complete